MKQTRFFLAASLFLFLILPAISGLAMSAPTTPLETVRTLMDTIKQIRKGDDLTREQEANNRKLSDEALRYLDVARVSKITLGKYWKKRSEEERRKFIHLLSELFRVVAFPNSAKFFSELELNYGDPREEKDKAVVPLTVIHKDEGEVHIDFVLKKNQEEWRVVDVILDGVSMRNNLRTQFYKVLKKEDYPELVRRMMKKLKEAKS